MYDFACFHRIRKIIPTLKSLITGTSKTINFAYIPNGKLLFLDVPIFKHIRVIIPVETLQEQGYGVVPIHLKTYAHLSTQN